MANHDSSLPKPPPGFISLADLQKTSNKTVSVIARVQSVLPDFIALTDFSTFEQSSSDMETLANFDKNGGWSLSEEPSRGDVVFLKGMNKKAGYNKRNPMLYTNRMKTSIFFFNTKMQIFGEYPEHVNTSSYTPGHPVYEYAEKLIEDWRKDPQSGIGTVTENGNVQSFYMTLKDVFDHFDTSRFTTLRGKIKRLSAKVFELTDAPGWKVVVEGYNMEDEVSQRTYNEALCCVEVTYVRFLSVDRSAKELHAKTTGRSTMLSVSREERLEMELLFDEEKEEEEDEEETDKKTDKETDKETDKQTGGNQETVEHLGNENTEDVPVPEDSPSEPPSSLPHSETGEDYNLYSEDGDLAASIRSRCASAVPAEKETSNVSTPPTTKAARDLSHGSSRESTPVFNPASTQARVAPDLSPEPREAQPLVAERVARDLSPESSRDPTPTQHRMEQPEPSSPETTTPAFPVPSQPPQIETEVARDLPCDPFSAPREPTPSQVSHDVRARKKLKTESPISRVPSSRVPAQAPSSTPIFVSSQGPPPPNERPLGSQGPMFIMSEYVIPDTELPYLVVSGTVDEAGVTDGILWFRIYCESVDRHYLVKIRKEDERDFLGIKKLNEETKVKVFIAWAGLREQVKVNMITDDSSEEGLQYWSVGNSLELQM